MNQQFRSVVAPPMELVSSASKGAGKIVTDLAKTAKQQIFNTPVSPSSAEPQSSIEDLSKKGKPGDSSVNSNSSDETTPTQDQMAAKRNAMQLSQTAKQMALKRMTEIRKQLASVRNEKLQTTDKGLVGASPGEGPSVKKAISEKKEDPTAAAISRITGTGENRGGGE